MADDNLADSSLSAENAAAAPATSTSTANNAVADAMTDTPQVASDEITADDQETNGQGPITTTGETSGVTVIAPDANASGEAASKKKDKRRSSAGIPEHKAKKLNRKKSTAVLQLDAQPGDHYWTRLKGYAPWPSIICDDEMLPETLLQNRPVTARRPDGSYREDFLEGGKNVRERTYPVMYLGTYEFSWSPNTELTPLQREEVENATQGKKSKALFAAYQQAAEWNDLGHYKETLAKFETERHQAEEEAQKEQERKESQAAEKQDRKDKKEQKEQKTKRKSKAAADDEDEEMPDADADDEVEKKTPKPKKRKKEVDEEDAKPARTPKSIKIQVAKTPKSEATSGKKSKAKGTPKTATKAEPPMSEADKFEKRKKEILYFRHKLQKGFLTRDVPPKEDDMAQMAQYFDSLEHVQNLEASIIRDTRIHKVLRGIGKLASIPKDEDFDFKVRSAKLLEKWNKVLDDDAGTAEPKTNGVAGSPKADADEPLATTEKEEDSKDEVKEPVEAPVEQVTPGDDAKDEAVDLPAAVAETNLDDVKGTEDVAESPKPDAAAVET